MNRTARRMNKQLARGRKTTGKKGCLFFFVGRTAAVVASAATLVAFAACREPAAADDPVTWEPIGSAVQQTINW